MFGFGHCLHGVHPQNGIPGIFQNSAMATLGLKEMGKFLWEGREKGRDLYIAKNQKLCQSQNSKWKNFAKAEYWHLF